MMPSWLLRRRSSRHTSVPSPSGRVRSSSTRSQGAADERGGDGGGVLDLVAAAGQRGRQGGGHPAVVLDQQDPHPTEWWQTASRGESPSLAAGSDDTEPAELRSCLVSAPAAAHDESRLTPTSTPRSCSTRTAPTGTPGPAGRGEPDGRAGRRAPADVLAAVPGGSGGGTHRARGVDALRAPAPAVDGRRPALPGRRPRPAHRDDVGRRGRADRAGGDRPPAGRLAAVGGGGALAAGLSRLPGLGRAPVGAGRRLLPHPGEALGRSASTAGRRR